VPDDEVATRQPLGGGVTRWLLAAPSRPGSGPFGLHLGLGGPCRDVAVLPPVVGGVARTGDGLDGDMLTAARRREFHEPVGSAGPEGPGLLLLRRPVGYRLWRWRSCPPACALFG
jgi:hypothetical protein